MTRRALASCLLLLAALVWLPAVASADRGHGNGNGRDWQDWRPGWDDDAVEVEVEEEDVDEEAPAEEEPPADEEPLVPVLEEPLDWYDDLEDSGDGPARAPQAAKAPKRPTTASGSTRLARVPYRSQILRYAKARNLEPAFVAAIVRAESGFNPRARSSAGARGLMQLMPPTARGMGVDVKRLYEPTTSIAYGTLYLTRVRQVVGSDLRLIAAGYNAGPNAVKRFRGIPPYAETRTYVRRVMAYRAAYRGR